MTCVKMGVKAGRTPILTDINLGLQPGEFVGLLGPSGCGKSTLLTRLAGLFRPSSGEVALDGTPLHQLSIEARKGIGFVPQDDIVHGPLTVDKALGYAARLRGLGSDKIGPRIEHICKQLELSERRYTRIDRLSGGQRKRVSIGVELLNEPVWLFLDEPTAGLDPALEESFMDTCRQLTREGRAVVMSTHVISSLDRLDLLIVLNKGLLQYVGPATEAASYFGVSQLLQIYKLLLPDAAASGASRFAATHYYSKYVGARLP